MSLISFHADFSRVVSALERIADALERLSPIRQSKHPHKMTFYNVDPEAIREAEEEADRKREAGTEGAT